MLLFLSYGCASAGRYFLNRLSDFGDCFTLEAGVGYGLDVHVFVTNLISTGVGASFVPKVAGISHGTPYIGLTYHIGMPILPFANLFSKEGRKEFWVTDAVHRGLPSPTKKVIRQPPPGYVAKSVLFLNMMSILPSKEGEVFHGYRNPDMAIFDVEVAATVGLLYFRVGFSIGEFVDFLLGWFGIDIAKDDKIQ